MINTYCEFRELFPFPFTPQIYNKFFIYHIFLRIFFYVIKHIFFRLNFYGNIWKIKIFYYRKIFKIFMLNFKNF